METGYKIVKDNMTSFYDGKTKWIIGETLIHPDPDKSSNAACGKGYHISPTPWQAASYNKPGKLLKVTYRKCHVLGQDVDKLRVCCVTPVKELNKHEVYGPNWKKVIKKISLVSDNRKFYTATKKCPKRLLNEVLRRFEPFSKNEKLTAESRPFKTWAAAWDAARDAAWDAARDAARAAAWDAARAAAWDAARDAAWDAAWAAAWDAAWDAARAAAWDAAWAAAWDAAWAVVADKMKTKNPFESLTNIWLEGYIVFFDGNVLVAGYVEKS